MLSMNILSIVLHPPQAISALVFLSSALNYCNPSTT